jgi:methylglutaconyl-CoA hydratase
MRAAADFDFEQNVAGGRAIYDLMRAVNSCPKPVVGRINGAAIGGGAGLVSCCDIAVAAENAIFAFSEVRLGLIPAVISPFVIGKIGAGAARELFLSGERFDAKRALQIGLVQQVAAQETLDAAVAERVAQLLLGAPGAQAAIKELLRTIPGQPAAEQGDYAAELIARRRDSAEGREGMTAFLQKRTPAWHS